MFRMLKTRVAAMRTIAKLLTKAEEIARDGGTEQPAAEHLVLAALRLPDGTATRTFERLGVSEADFIATLEAQEADDLERVGVRADSSRIGAALPPATEPTGIYRSEPSARELFRAAGDDARRGGGALLGAHVLRAAASLEHGRTARAFRRMGLAQAELRAAASREIEAESGSGG